MPPMFGPQGHPNPVVFRGHEDPDEYQRNNFNLQYDLIKRGFKGGRILHPSIPQTQIRGAVADVRCGTGIWLTEFKKSFDANREIECVGFDVNSNLFDMEYTISGGVEFVIHDATKRFPKRWHAHFDVVQVNDLAFSVKEKDFLQFVKNIAEIVRPGGYIDWGEINTRDAHASSNSKINNKAMEIVRLQRQACHLVPHILNALLTNIRHLQSTSETASSTNSSRDALHLVDYEIREYVPVHTDYLTPMGAHLTCFTRAWLDPLQDAQKRMMVFAMTSTDEAMKKTWKENADWQYTFIQIFKKQLDNGGGDVHPKLAWVIAQKPAQISE